MSLTGCCVDSTASVPDMKRRSTAESSSNDRQLLKAVAAAGKDAAGAADVHCQALATYFAASSSMRCCHPLNDRYLITIAPTSFARREETSKFAQFKMETIWIIHAEKVLTSHCTLGVILLFYGFTLKL